MGPHSASFISPKPCCCHVSLGWAVHVERTEPTQIYHVHRSTLRKQNCCIEGKSFHDFISLRQILLTFNIFVSSFSSTKMHVVYLQLGRLVIKKGFWRIYFTVLLDNINSTALWWRYNNSIHFHDTIHTVLVHQDVDSRDEIKTRHSQVGCVHQTTWFFKSMNYNNQSWLILGY